MNRESFKRYRKNIKEHDLVNKALDRLQERLNNVEIVSGKVSKSGDDFPYIEGHVTVQMQEPKEATEIKRKIREKEERKALLETEIKAVENYIAAMPAGIDKEIFEMVYLDRFSQSEAAEMIGYSKGWISQIITERLNSLNF